MKYTHAEVTGHWRGSFAGSGVVTAPGFSSGVTLPKDFGGLGENATPEDLLLSALASCFLITYGIILEKNRVSYESLRISAELKTKVDFPPRIQEAALQPEIISDADPTLLKTLAERAEKMCLISQAVDGNVIKSVNLVVRRMG